MTQLITRRRAGAGVATGALIASALLFAPSAQAATTTDVRETQIAATGAPFSTGYHHEGDGTYKVVNTGLELTGNSAFVRGYTNNTSENLGTTGGNADLDKLGATSVVSTGAPVVKVAVYSDNVAGESDNKLTTLTQGAEGTWTTSAKIGTGDTAIDAGATKPTADIVTALKPNYRVKGFGVFNTTGTATVSSLTFDDVTYQFKNNAPTVADRSVSTKINTPVAISLAATDVDGNELSYAIDSVVGGAVTGSGATQTFIPAKNFKGSASVKYTVTDGRGGSASATITVKVDKSKGRVEIYRIHPTRPSVRSTVYIYASIQVDGQKAKPGTTIYAYAKGKKVVTAKVNSTGKVKLKLPNKLPKGNATLKVTQVGSATLNGDSDSIKVKVRG